MNQYSLASLFAYLCLLAFNAQANSSQALLPLDTLRQLSIVPLAFDEELQVAVARLSEAEQLEVLKANHEKGRCGGYELLEEAHSLWDGPEQVLYDLKLRALKDLVPSAFISGFQKIHKRSEIDSALSKLKATQLETWITKLAAYQTRSSRSASPNRHVEELKAQLSELVGPYPFAKVSLISHVRSNQKTLKVSLAGSLRPQEIVILGGHLDSVNTSFERRHLAPGADDNASGSANLIEALRVLVSQGQPQRTIEFYWYAAEEVGLVGSGEIAEQYRRQRKDVVAVLQLDMTLHAGSGELVIGNILDFTSPWLRDLLVQLNDHYVGAEIIEDRCGYGCSDHASWYRRGYPTVLPFEASARRINPLIHTQRDLVNRDSNFEHSLAFSKLALAMAMELGNSALRQP